MIQRIIHSWKEVWPLLPLRMRILSVTAVIATYIFSIVTHWGQWMSVLIMVTVFTGIFMMVGPILLLSAEEAEEAEDISSTGPLTSTDHMSEPGLQRIEEDHSEK